MTPYANPRHLAVMGGASAFQSITQPFAANISIRPWPCGGEYSAVVSILRNVPSPGSMLLSRQRYVSKGHAGAGPSHRSDLQRRLTESLCLDAGTTSVICVSSGAHALRAALKVVLADSESKTRNKIIVPTTTVDSTAEAVIMEGFAPVLTDVDPHSWMLSPEATEQKILEKTAAIITVDWIGTYCNLGLFCKLADKARRQAHLGQRSKLRRDPRQTFCG